MGIDGIGKPKAPVAGLGPSAAASDASRVTKTETFSVQSKTAEGVEATSPLDQLRAGTIDREQYVEMTVKQATAHLEGKISAQKLEWIRDSLRAQVEEDPALADMIRRLPGQTSNAADGNR